MLFNDGEVAGFEMSNTKFDRCSFDDTNLSGLTLSADLFIDCKGFGWYNGEKINMEKGLRRGLCKRKL
jgi:hypothetical protein